MGRFSHHARGGAWRETPSQASPWTPFLITHSAWTQGWAQSALDIGGFRDSRPECNSGLASTGCLQGWDSWGASGEEYLSFLSSILRPPPSAHGPLRDLQSPQCQAVSGHIAPASSFLLSSTLETLGYLELAWLISISSSRITSVSFPLPCDKSYSQAVWINMGLGLGLWYPTPTERWLWGRFLEVHLPAWVFSRCCHIPYLDDHEYSKHHPKRSRWVVLVKKP